MANRIYKPNGAYTEYRGHNMDGTPKFIDVVYPLPTEGNYPMPAEQNMANGPTFMQTAGQNAASLARSAAAWQDLQDNLAYRRSLMTQPGGFLSNDSNVLVPLSTQIGQAVTRQPVMDFPVPASMARGGGNY